MAGLNLGQSPLDTYTEQDRDILMNPTTPTQAAFELSWENTPVGALSRIYSQREAEQAGGEKVLPGTLNEMFPDLPEKFSEPTSMRVAQLISDRHENRRKLQLAIENGPKDFIGGAMTMSASLLPHIIDPLNVAASFATAGLSNYFAGAKALKMAAQMGISVEAAKNLIPAGTRFAMSVGENLAANLAMEPVIYAANRMDNNPYTAKDAFENAVIPAIAFPLIGFGGKKLLRAAGLMDPVQTSAIHSASIGRMAEGKDPSIGGELLAKSLVRETSGTGFKPYEYKSVDISNVSDRPYYSGTVDGEKGLIGEYLGKDTVYLSDNANVANGSAARAGARAPGDVVEMDLSNVKLADLNSPNQEIMDLVKGITGDKFDSPNNLIERLTTMADAGNEEAYSKFQSGIKAMGYDGVSYKLDKFLDQEHPPHNVAAIFNPDKLTEKSKSRANPEFVPRLSKEEIKAFAEKRLNEDLTDEAFVQDPDGIKQVMAVADAPKIQDEKLAEMKSTTKEYVDQLAEVEKLGTLDADELRQVEEVRRLVARQEKVPLATAQALACIRRG